MRGTLGGYFKKSEGLQWYDMCGWEAAALTEGRMIRVGKGLVRVGSLDWVRVGRATVEVRRLAGRWRGVLCFRCEDDLLTWVKVKELSWTREVVAENGS